VQTGEQLCCVHSGCIITVKIQDLNHKSLFREKHFLRTIQARLIFWFIFLSLLPALVIATGTIIVDYNNGRHQALERLDSVAALKESELNFWLSSIQTRMMTALNEEYALERAQSILSLSGEKYFSEYFKKAARFRLQLNMQDTNLLNEMAFLDVQGIKVVSTNLSEEGKMIEVGNISQTVQNSPFSIVLQPEAIYFFIPLFDISGNPLGFMFGQCTYNQLISILSKRTGLGSTGIAYLVDAESRRIGSPDPLVAGGESQFLSVNSPGIESAIQTKESGSDVYPDYEGVQVIGVYRWLPELQTALLIEQDLSEAFVGILTNLRLNLLVVFLTIFLAIGASLGISRSISRPVTNLVTIASSIAGGDLNRSAPEGDDEMGTLAAAFNSMTVQLRELINSLEQRVQERTIDLRQRALQLEASAHVSREITSILEINELMNRIVDLIRKTFDYHAVGIYLSEKSSGLLTLRASSGTEFPYPKTLNLDEKSINGRAAMQNQAVVVNDISRSFDSPVESFLPDTRSALVIPLSMGENVIGTLDVQSCLVNAFQKQEITVLQSLGDQIAIAIENANLYEQSQKLATLEERSRLARELHDSVTQALYSLALLLKGWTQIQDQGKEVKLRDVLEKTGEINQQVLKEMRLLIHELRPPDLESDGLLNALQKRLDSVENRAGLQARLLAEDFTNLPPQVEENFYRIAIEALNNAIKHSGAGQIIVRFYQQRESYRLEISDDGCGFSLEDALKTGGLGLINMQDRARKIHASIDILSAPGKGSLISVELPVEIINMN
jgi:nitrate/nitrite-specific signal transduction histidine kinase